MSTRFVISNPINIILCKTNYITSDEGEGWWTKYICCAFSDKLNAKDSYELKAWLKEFDNTQCRRIDDRKESVHRIWSCWKRCGFLSVFCCTHLMINCFWGVVVNSVKMQKVRAAAVCY